MFNFYDEMAKTASVEDEFGPIIDPQIEEKICSVCGKVHTQMSWVECAWCAFRDWEDEMETRNDLLY